MKLRRPVAHAGSFGSVDPAGSPACRGWRSENIKADCTPEKIESHKSNPNTPTASQRNSSSRQALEAFCFLMEIALDAKPVRTTISSWRRSR
jgi:hypothetical protein